MLILLLMGGVYVYLTKTTRKGDEYLAIFEKGLVWAATSVAEADGFRFESTTRNHTYRRNPWPLLDESRNITKATLKDGDRTLTIFAKTAWEESTLEDVLALIPS